MIWFVGAGPGDPELITVKGRRLLEAADVVLYAGSLVPVALLDWTPPGCACHDSAGMHLDEQVRIMAAAHGAGRRVVRLHTGDPSLFGAIGEQMRALDGLAHRLRGRAGSELVRGRRRGPAQRADPARRLADGDRHPPGGAAPTA